MLLVKRIFGIMCAKNYRLRVVEVIHYTAVLGIGIGRTQ